MITYFPHQVVDWLGSPMMVPRLSSRTIKYTMFQKKITLPPPSVNSPVHRSMCGKTALVEIGIFADKKVIIPFYLFSVSANLCNIFQSLFFTHNHANHVGNFARFLEFGPKSLIMQHSAHPLVRILQGQFEFCDSVLYPFSIFPLLFWLFHFFHVHKIWPILCFYVRNRNIMQLYWSLETEFQW